MNITSADAFLGVPFNITSYALLTHLIAHVCNLQVGEFIHTIGDAHLYEDHIILAKEQIKRTPLILPTLQQLNKNITDINQFTMNDISLLDYNYHPAITAKMSV